MIHSYFKSCALQVEAERSRIAKTSKTRMGIVSYFLSALISNASPYSKGFILCSILTADLRTWSADCNTQNSALFAARSQQWQVWEIQILQVFQGPSSSMATSSALHFSFPQLVFHLICNFWEVGIKALVSSASQAEVFPPNLRHIFYMVARFIEAKTFPGFPDRTIHWHSIVFEFHH